VKLTLKPRRRSATDVASACRRSADAAQPVDTPALLIDGDEWRDGSAPVDGVGQGPHLDGIVDIAAEQNDSAGTDAPQERLERTGRSRAAEADPEELPELQAEVAFDHPGHRGGTVIEGVRAGKSMVNVTGM
jgi:hypothetical protein